MGLDWWLSHIFPLSKIFARGDEVLLARPNINCRVPTSHSGLLTPLAGLPSLVTLLEASSQLRPPTSEKRSVAPRCSFQRLGLALSWPLWAQLNISSGTTGLPGTSVAKCHLTNKGS